MKRLSINRRAASDADEAGLRFYFAYQRSSPQKRRMVFNEIKSSDQTNQNLIVCDPPLTSYFASRFGVRMKLRGIKSVRDHNQLFTRKAATQKVAATRVRIYYDTIGEVSEAALQPKSEAAQPIIFA